jgi:hypothetical protein
MPQPVQHGRVMKPASQILIGDEVKIHHKYVQIVEARALATTEEAQQSIDRIRKSLRANNHDLAKKYLVILGREIEELMAREDGNTYMLGAGPTGGRVYCIYEQQFSVRLTSD